MEISMPVARFWLITAVVCGSLVHLPARADSALAPRPLGKLSIKVDGSLSEWRGARFARLGNGEDGEVEYTLGYDAQALYVGARVRDDSFVRTRSPSPREDALVIALALPNAKGAFETTEVWLFAGIPGSQAASASLARRGGALDKSTAIAVVEGPLPRGARGHVLEARVPWSALANGREFQLGRGAIRLNDVDGKPGNARVIASASGARLPPLLCEGGPNAALEDFLKAKDLDATSVRHDLVGDVAGDARLERVLVAGTFAVVSGGSGSGVGPKGADFAFVDLPIAMSSAVQSAALRDLTGDGKAELILRLRQQNDLGARDLFQVLDLSRGQPQVALAIELRKQTGAGSVEAELTIGRAQGGTPPALEVRPGQARGLDGTNFAEQASADAQPILLPWGAIARRVYRWDGARFAVVEEEPSRNAPKLPPRRTDAPPPASSAAAGPAPKVHAKPPGEDELVAAFREQRGIDPGVTARFVQRANVAEDGRIESLMVFGKDLLVVGKGFRGGTGFFFYGLPVRAPEDVLRVFTGDVTGDGRRELFVRIRQRLGDVQREILLAYTFDEEGIAELLGTEVRRAQGEQSVGNRVRLVRDGGHYALRIDPGVARGWDERNYPFVAESTDAYGPLLLPWADASVQYRYDGRRLVRASAGR